MSITLAVGTTVSVGSTYGASKAISAISNAATAVATFEAAHGIIVGDIVHITSGWELLNNRVVRVSAVATNDISLEGVNTTDTELYPTGAGVGSGREVTGWTEVTQITRQINVSGGEQTYADTSTLKNRQDTRVPVSRTPVDVVLPVFDDPTLAWVAAVQAVDSIETAGVFVYPNGRRVYYAGYWTVGDVATVEDSTLRNAVTVSFASRPISYAS
jgi:Phage tail tube protein, TTP